MDVVRQNYPSGLWVDNPQYRKSEEFTRQIIRRDDAENNNERWLKFLSELQYALKGSSITDKTMFRYDCSYRVQISDQNNFSGLIIACVSVLAPVYVVYSLPADQPAISKDQICATVYPDVKDRAGISDHAIDQLIHRLRTKIKSKYTVTTHRGLGYQLS